MLMSDLTNRSSACKGHLNMLIENALYKFITLTITILLSNTRKFYLLMGAGSGTIGLTMFKLLNNKLELSCVSK